MILNPREEGEEMRMLLKWQVTHDVVRLKINIFTIPQVPSEMILSKGDI
jgi:hypothetical protein